MRSTIKNISRDYIEFENGERYYHEDYVKEMNRRNYERGLNEGRKIVIHKCVVENINDSNNETP